MIRFTIGKQREQSYRSEIIKKGVGIVFEVYLSIFLLKGNMLGLRTKWELFSDLFYANLITGSLETVDTGTDTFTLILP